MVTLKVSGVLWDRIVDSLSGDYPDLGIGRRGPWEWANVGFGSQASIQVPKDAAREILDYLETLAGLDGSGMDAEGAADTRKEAKAAATAAKWLRKQLP